jgi:extracellular solute-binding protein/von Willebrand factor type A domain-containing protein
LPGRHESPGLQTTAGKPGRRRTKAVLISAGVLALVGALAVTGWALNRPVSQVIPQCVGSISLRVTAAPDVAPTITEIADNYSETKPRAGSRCIDVVVKSESSAKVADDIAAGKGIPPNLWVPDSSVWAEKVTLAGQQAAAAGRNGSPAKVTVADSLASSPLVVVAPRPVAESLGGNTQTFSWSELLPKIADSASPIKPTVTSPETTSEGLTATLTLNRLFGDNKAAIQALLSIARSAVPDVATAYKHMAENPQGAPVFPASERSVVAYNRSAPPVPVSALYASEGSYPLNFPTIRVTTGETPTSLDVAAGKFEQALRAPESVAAFQRAGFRSPDGMSTGFSPELGVLPPNPPSLGTAKLSDAAALLNDLRALKMPVRMLAVIDISGSMNQRSQYGRRIDIAVEAAKLAVALFPPESDVGLWAFSNDQVGTQDWIEIEPLRRLHEPVEGGSTQFQRLDQGLNTLPGRTVGGTGLYDTTLAAFEQVRATYDPNKVNSVVILTDGRDEYDEGALKLNELLDRIRGASASDPSKPVIVFPVGMGPDVDMDVLNQIAQATGIPEAKAYQVESPTAIRDVFLDAMRARTVRQ